METMTRRTSTSSVDGSDSWTPLKDLPEAGAASEAAREQLLSADGSLIPVTREEAEAPRREPPPQEKLRMQLRAWRSRAAERVASAAPSEIAVSAFAAGVVAGVVLGVASARR